MFLRLLRRVGVACLTAFFTVLAIAIAAAITAGISTIADRPVGWATLVIAVTAPAIIVPAFTYVLLSLIAKLDAAEARLKEISTIDDLTGVYNRRRILELGDRERMRALRYKGPMSVAIIDIDRFKHINDTYGHGGGDAVLQQLAAICVQHSREIDHFARYGGDEFMFVLPQATADQALELAERIRARLADSPALYGGRDIPFTVSAGVACLMNETLDALLLRADNALYLAKKRGRNTIVAAGAPPELALVAAE